MTDAAPKNDPEFGAPLALTTESSDGSRRSKGAKAIAVGAVAFVLVGTFAYTTWGHWPSDGGALVVLVLSVVGALALRRAYRLLWGPGLPEFYEKGLVDRGKRIAYKDIVEARTSVIHHETHGTYTYTAYDTRLCLRTDDVMWRFNATGPCPDLATVLGALERQNPEIVVRKIRTDSPVESMSLTR